jgi:hypothetical protein
MDDVNQKTKKKLKINKEMMLSGIGSVLFFEIAYHFGIAGALTIGTLILIILALVGERLRKKQN